MTPDALANITIVALVLWTCWFLYKMWIDNRKAMVKWHTWINRHRYRLVTPPQPVFLKERTFEMNGQICLVFELPAVPPEGRPVRRFVEVSALDQILFRSDAPIQRCRLQVLADHNTEVVVKTWTFDAAGNQSLPSYTTQVALDTFPPPEPPAAFLVQDEVREADDDDFNVIVFDDDNAEPEDGNTTDGNQATDDNTEGNTDDDAGQDGHEDLVPA